KDGALLTYGPNTTELMQRVAIYVAKILKGARPSDQPIERPTHFDLVINLKTAKLFGLTVPPTLLGRADHVISSRVVIHRVRARADDGFGAEARPSTSGRRR